MADSVVKFLLKSSECYFGVSVPEENWYESIIGYDNLDDFLKIENKSTIYVSLDNNKLKFSNEINTNTNQKIIIFYKIKPSSILNNNNNDFINNIQTTTIYGSPTLALYQSLNSIYCPLLAQGNNSNIHRQIINLQADLRSSLLIEENQEINDSFNSLTVVDSLEHEVEYWENTVKNARDRLTRTSGEDFKQILKPLATEFNVIDVLPLNEIEDLLENAHNVFDDLWRHEPPYPKERIQHLMDIIANEIIKCMSKQLLNNNIWKENYVVIAELLQQCISIGEHWLTSCKQLTELFWPYLVTNPWKDPPYQPTDLIKFNQRLNEILHIQTLHRQLIRLLTAQEQEILKTNMIFEPFQQLNILDFGQYSTNLWLKAYKQFEYLLQPAEERVGEKLKKQLSNINANTRQLLYEFSRYSELINRPILRQTLLSERQYLLTSLYDYVQQLQQQQNNDVATTTTTTKLNATQIVNEVIFIKQLEARVDEIQKTSQKLLNDLQNFENLNQIVTEFLKDLKQQHIELYESWTSDMMALIKNKNLGLKESDPVVEFSTNKLMKVNYSPRLVTLINEVRQFKALGYNIPGDIEQISEHAKKFMRLARSLEQIANFHNTIGDRMIICQRPMMLASALELSKLVQEEKVVYWSDTKSIEKYVEKLKRAVEKLSKENNLLASYYYQINDKIKLLGDIDLIKDYSRWKDIIKQIRNILNQVEEKGFKNMQMWKNDIDLNLFKILEKQYIKSLNTLHLYLPEIYTDIIYRNNKLQFSPDIDQLKEKYHQQHGKFLEIPKNFKGVVDNPDKNIFAEILDKNSADLEKVDKQTDDLFQQLDAVLKHWQSWLQLEPLDVNQLKIWQHWDLHFRASKTFGQEIAKLPNTEERLGCFLIGLQRLRTDLEIHNRSYWDQLVLSLKDSIVDDVVKLQNYIDPATAVLTRQPVTIDEIGETGVNHANIVKQAAEMEECYNQMLQKAQILASWAREYIDSVNRLKGAWERLQSLLENHQHIIAKQMETIKTTLQIEYENLMNEMERFNVKFEQIKPKLQFEYIIEQSIDNLNQQLIQIKDKKKQWLEILERQTKLLNDYERFNLEKPNFEIINVIENDLKKIENSWRNFEEFYQELETLSNEEWIVFRKKIYRFEDFLTNWQTKLKTNQEDSNDLTTRILQEIQKFEGVSPCLKYVRGEDFTEKHWMDIFNILQMPPKSLENLTLKDFLQVSDKLIDNSKQLHTICKKAASEIVVRQALAELDQWEIQAKFVLTPHKNTRNSSIMLIKDFKEILNKIGDNQSLLQSVKNSSDYESFSERANLWETKLANLDQNITLLAQIQRKWVYLEPIFGNGALIHDRNRFEKIDRDFQHLLLFIEKDCRIVALARYPNLSTILKNLQEQLGRCQKSLETFLQEKRDRFARFLFLSDDDLLEIIGQSTKEQIIQQHLKKLFTGIHSIRLDDNHRNITAICSQFGEIVPLNNQVNIEKPIEDWLNDLVKQMQTTLKELLVQCLNDGQSPDPLKYPSQILCLADSINFTLKVEQAINNMTLPPLLAYYKAQLSHYSSLELNIDEQNDDTNVLEMKLKSLLLDTIHHINIIEELLDSNTTKIADWLWQKQLRFYSNSLGGITIKMSNARIEYAYEYLGNVQKLVRTQLTDRCFLTLTQCIYLGMGGNPYGPAGTGKTETIKALGQLLGRQVLVFNCDENIDTVSMCRILNGLVRSGAWGCFDEFNRLEEATLSAISMQIQPIQTALRTGQDKLVLMDQEITVNRHCGIFVTLNPAGGNYGGRNRLPDNLKQLFRPIIMTHPDCEEITKTLLHCDGYQNAELISRKLIEIFQLCDKLLSKQQHYDWGLRAIRTILNSCGENLRKYRRINANEINLNTELQLIIQILRNDILSKLTYNDAQKFESILSDVFRNINIDINNVDDNLTTTLKECCTNSKLTPNQRQINKCLELYGQLKQRMGIVIVGPPNSGKTTIRNLLLQALIRCGKPIKQHVFNPKSIQKSELLGQIDFDTRQWKDGVLTMYSLQVTQEPADIWSWIVCDGNIDPDWIESLNSVLDDNRLLTLPSGWRIQFGRNVNFIFETHDLSYASPATISRLGIVFLDDNDLELNDYLQNYLVENETKISIENSLINDHLLQAINWIVNDAEIVVPCSKLTILKIALSQLYGVENKAQFVVGLVNGLGQILQEDFRELFAQQVFDWLAEPPPPFLSKVHYNRERDFIDNYYTNPNITIEINDSNTIPLILTGDICKTLDQLRIWLLPGNEQNFLLIGPHGSAKTLILEYLVKERTDVELITIYCCANLTRNYILNKITQNCITVNTNKGKIYKPKRGHLIIYFKNLQLLKPDQWGTNILIEFLNQLITYKAFFDTNLELVGIENITIIGTLTTNNLSLSRRFLSKINIFNITQPEQEDLSLITITYLSAILNYNFPEKQWTKTKLIKLSTMILAIYARLCNFFQTTQYLHYIFTPHDLINWCRNLSRYNLNNYDNIDKKLNEILCYEAIKLFGDKLTNIDDHNKLSNLLIETFNITNLLEIMKDNFYIPSSSSSSTEDKLIDINRNDWEILIKKSIIQYSRDGQQLDLLINNELLIIISSLIRVLSSRNGNVVMIGKSGVGRKSSLKILTILQTAKLITLINDKQPQFNNELKLALQLAGIDGQDVYLLLEDHILNNDSVLSMINVLISAGEIPGLYSTPELDSMISGLKDEANRENFEGNLMNFYIERIKQHLHVIVCIDTDNENIWRIFENCPALLYSSQIIWKSQWCEETINNIPMKIIEKFNETSLVVENCTKFPQILKVIETSQINTPLRYISMIKLYIDIYSERKSTIIERQNKLKAGIEKLTDAGELVAKLKQKANEQEERLSEKQTKANSALDMISKTMQNANLHKEEMESLKQKTEQENRMLMTRKQEIENELAEVEPLIQEARSAVGNIKTEALSEIRSLRAPPEIIRDILEGVLRLMGINDTSWNSMKTFLSKRGVKEEIRSFDASRITSESRQSVQRLITNKKDSFDPKQAKRASVAAAPLAAWVLANIKYSQVYEKIKPLEREQLKLKENLTSAELQLNDLSAGLSDVDATVAKLKQQLANYTKEAAEIEIDLNKVQNTLKTAEDLVNKLDDEYNRWKKQLVELTNQIEKLSDNCCLASAFSVYLSNESENTRREILQRWMDDLKVGVFNFEEFLSTDREQLQWQTEGLPSDKLSKQNAIIVLKTKITPLLIDPTSSAINWLKNRLKSYQLECTTQNSQKFLNTLELSIRFGKILIIEEIDRISTNLLPILRQEFIYQGERKLINFNGKLIDYHNDFKLILTSRNEQLQISSDFNSIITTMNFTVTQAGLMEQLLSAAIRQEKPQLEERRQHLLKEREELEEKQYRLQNQLLEDLANSSGDILQNSSLLESLNQTKVSSIAISKALQESMEVQTKLQSEYEIYQMISTFGSSLYFACNEFSKFNVLYVLSVSAYVKLFLNSLQSFQVMQTSEDLQKRHLFDIVYNFMSRGIFKNDRTIFALHLTKQLYNIPKIEWELFLDCINAGKLEEDLPPWLPKQLYNNILNLKANLPEFYQNLRLEEPTIWQNFMSSKVCQKEFPQHLKLTEFERVLLIKSLRPDRTYTAIIQCILHLTGLKSTDPPVIDLKQIYKESNNTEPILLLTVSGSDPTNEIHSLANNLNYQCNEIAMGEGQEMKALTILQKTCESGQWLVLKNLHLVTNWLTVLCQNLQQLQTHDNFRLWLITEYSQNFNFVLAQNSLKFVYETPQGLRNNLLRTYNNFNGGYFDKFNQTMNRLFFVMAYLHGILQERRRFIPQGWLKFYEFSDNDLTTTIRLIEDFWNTNSNQIPWKTIKGLCRDAVYGGRIENINDLTILDSYLKQYLIDEVLSHRWNPFDKKSPLPNTNKYQDYINYFKQLPEHDLPEYFGLPENIDRAWEKQTSLEIVTKLKNLSISCKISPKFDRNFWYKNLSPLINLWRKLNQGYDFIRQNHQTIQQQLQQDPESIIRQFINQEYRIAVNLIQQIHKNFSILHRICKGNQLPDDNDLSIGHTLINQRIPKLWKSKWDGNTNEPQNYLRNLLLKTINLSKWKNTEQICLRDLLNPDGFLAAYKQEFSRTNKIEIDQLVLETKWKTSGNRRNYLVLTDLLIEGGLFDGYNLKPCAATSDSINQAPNCYITWNDKKLTVEDNCLNVPVYYSSNRLKFLTNFQIMCDSKEHDRWIQAGLAFYVEY